MHLTCLQEQLKRGLATVSHTVAGKSTLPILANVLLATDGGRLKLAATNLELGITHWIGAQVQMEGAITVPAKLLADVVGSLPADTVTLTLDGRTQTLKVACGRFTSTIKGIQADEFPVIPSITDQAPVTSVSSDVLREVINQADVGDNTGELDGMIHGEGGQIALNVTYLAELLTCVKSAQIAIETQSPQSPGVFKPVGQADYVHIIMPMSMR